MSEPQRNRLADWLLSGCPLIAAHQLLDVSLSLVVGEGENE